MITFPLLAVWSIFNFQLSLSTTVFFVVFYFHLSLSLSLVSHEMLRCCFRCCCSRFPVSLFFFFLLPACCCHLLLLLLPVSLLFLVLFLPLLMLLPFFSFGRQEDAAARVRARPLPSRSQGFYPRPSDRPLTETTEFQLSSQARHERAAQEFRDRVRKEEERARRATEVGEDDTDCLRSGSDQSAAVVTPNIVSCVNEHTGVGGVCMYRVAVFGPCFSSSGRFWWKPLPADVVVCFTARLRWALFLRHC